jgi:galactokinase
VRLTNAEPSYADVELELSTDVEPGTPHDWGDYARGVAQALVRENGITAGADIAVESDLPVAAGLSSSSALSCGVALALLAANGRSIDRVELAEVVARAERYTGTQGGGMDHAVILCAQAGYALGVSFAPLHIRPVSVPQDWVFLVAHSGGVAEKSGPAQATYNARTRECREALVTVWAALGKGDPPERDYRPLLEAADSEHLLRVGADALGPILLARFRHTLSEAWRVSEAEEALRVSDLSTFGRAMDASHKSLRDDYQVSTPELDRIVDLAREAGAAGARLTGAGLGGSALILCTEAAESAVREALEVGYYRLREGPSGLAVFRAAPSGGARVGTAPPSV